jgi:hypothetical protein
MQDLSGYAQRGGSPVPGFPAPVPRQIARQAVYQQRPDLLVEVERGGGPLKRAFMMLPWIKRGKIDEIFRRVRDIYKPINWVFNYALAANATATATQQTGIDQWFLITHITSMQTGNYTFQVQETESGDLLFPAAVGSGAGTGTGAQPFYLSEPWIVRGSLQTTVTDLTGAANAIWFVLCGVRVIPANARD